MSEVEAHDVARRHGVSVGAVEAVLSSLRATGGTSAQFNHPDLGGFGQWMPSGMVQVGDMFNTALRARVDALCAELAQHVRATGSAPARETSAEHWWPSHLGAQPDVAGGQNAARYAWFAPARRLVIDQAGRVTLYDTGTHHISGVAQSQGDRSAPLVVFSTDAGPLDLTSLPVVER